MELHVGKKFIHRHEGLSICAGVWKSGYTAYRLEYGKAPMWYWNNANWNNEKPYKKPDDWSPYLKNPVRLYNGCDICYVYEGSLIFGQLQDYDELGHTGDHLAITTDSDYLVYVPRKACKVLEWLANRKPVLRVVA